MASLTNLKVKIFAAGADLRGANIEGVDFYLVDLRDALYDAAQEEHFRACRAILESVEPDR